MTGPACKDCRAEGVTTHRPLKQGVPGPRCVTHWRAEKRRRSAAAHVRHIEKVYELTEEQYRILIAFQSVELGNPPGTCPICGRAKGTVKRLAVDHDHETGEVRGVMCGFCNHEVLGRLDLAALKRAVRYLENPPGRILRKEGSA